MKRFLMLVAVATVAGAMYVAASPASQQSGPTLRQFNALKKQVANLSKTLKNVRTEANFAAGFIATCFVTNNAGAVGVSQFGSTSDGFLFGAPNGGATAAARTALDADASTTPGAFLQAVDPTCVNTTAARHRQARSGNGHPLARPERAH